MNERKKIVKKNLEVIEHSCRVLRGKYIWRDNDLDTVAEHAQKEDAKKEGAEHDAAAGEQAAAGNAANEQAAEADAAWEAVGNVFG